MATLIKILSQLQRHRGNVSCTGPRACYDESKRFGETLCVSFHQVHNIPVKIARPLIIMVQA